MRRLKPDMKQDIVDCMRTTMGPSAREEIVQMTALHTIGLLENLHLYDEWFLEPHPTVAALERQVQDLRWELNKIRSRNEAAIKALTGAYN